VRGDSVVCCPGERRPRAFLAFASLARQCGSPRDVGRTLSPSIVAVHRLGVPPGEKYGHVKQLLVRLLDAGRLWLPVPATVPAPSCMGMNDVAALVA